jgi:tetratricopeptide (TPR) repeat protein
MKFIPTLFLIAICFTSICCAQQTRATNDALLVEYYQNQRFADALTYLKNIYTEPVTDAKELSRLAYVSSMARLLPDAEGYYHRVYDLDSTNTSVLYNLANINQRRGNNNKAEFYFKKLVVLDTLNFNAYARLAQIKRDKGDIDNALLYFERANKLNTTDADVAISLSELYDMKKRPTEAEKSLTIAITADPENIILQEALLKLYYVESKWKETVRSGEQLLLLGDSTVFTLAKLGRGYFQTKNYTCGISVLLTIPELDQTENTAYYTAACYKLLGDHKKAIQYFNKAVTLSISAGTATYYNEIADSYETQKIYKKAKENYLKGLLYDEQPLAYYYLATLFDAKLKDQKNALKYYKKYIAANPDQKQQKYKEYSVARIAALSHK